MTRKLAIYPGSFDPMTCGHIDIVRRALTVFDEIRVAVAFNKDKVDSGLFTPDERVAMIREVTSEFGDCVSVDSFSGLLVEYCRSEGSGTIVRGLRAVADFEYEFQLAMMNRYLAPDVETVFLMADQDHFYTSSSLIREVIALGGRAPGLVPDSIELELIKKFRG